MKRLLWAMTLLYSTHAVALLPPYYQTAKEITTILNDPHVAEKITSGRMIRSIIKTETGYTIQAGSCNLEIQIKYSPLPNGMVGPAVFEIEVSKFVCTS
jgi:hypothetical protein